MGPLRDNRIRLAAAVGALLIAAVVLAFAASSEKRVAGTNVLAPLNPTVEVRAEGTACQRIRNLPDGAGYARIRADSEAELIEPRITVSQRGRRVSSGSTQGPPGRIEVPLDPLTRSARRATLCVVNPAREPLLLYGERKRSPAGFVYRYGVTFLEAESSSLLTRADVIAQRYRNGQAGALGAWGMWLALTLALAGAGLALSVVMVAVSRA